MLDKIPEIFVSADDFGKHSELFLNKKLIGKLPDTVSYYCLLKTCNLFYKGTADLYDSSVMAYKKFVIKITAS